jgi:hypothetical protein
MEADYCVAARLAFVLAGAMEPPVPSSGILPNSPSPNRIVKPELLAIKVFDHPPIRSSMIPPDPMVKSDDPQSLVSPEASASTPKGTEVSACRFADFTS